MSGNSLGEAHLYFGCRHPEEDDLYKDEFDHAEKNGLVTVHRAYSRLDQDCKVYVQDVLLREAAQIIVLLDQGGHLYICGDGSKMAPAVENVLLQAYEKVHNTNSKVSLGGLNSCRRKEDMRKMFGQVCNRRVRQLKNVFN